MKQPVEPSRHERSSHRALAVHANPEELIDQRRRAVIAEQKAGNGSQSDQSTECVRVLVVDDQPDIVRTCAFLLRQAGFEVQTASSGYDALKQVREFDPQVVLLDIGLPDIDGCEVARRLRADATLHATTLIAITAYGTDDDRRFAQASGFDHLMVKPVPFETLLSIVGSSSH
jgi:CheY-like chemotaxis protein